MRISFNVDLIKISGILEIMRNVKGLIRVWIRRIKILKRLNKLSIVGKSSVGVNIRTWSISIILLFNGMVVSCVD